MPKPVSFRWDEGFVARIDEARKTGVGEVSRSAFVRRAVERALEGRSASVEPLPQGLAPAPAEQPVRRVSPSGPASPRVPFRRDVKPFQRGGS